MATETNTTINRTYEIFVGKEREEWHQDKVLASKIMEEAGTKDYVGFILEALDRPNGRALKDFKPDEEVDLTVKGRKFFRITPGGGGFS